MARNQTETITIRLTEEEKDALTEKLMHAGKPSWRQFILDMCMRGQIIVSEDMRKLNAELRRQGNNLNQLTKLANMGKIDEVYLGEVKDTLGKIYVELYRLARSKGSDGEWQSS